MIGSRGATVPVVLSALAVALLIACFPASSWGAEPAADDGGDRPTTSAGQYAAPQYSATPDAQEVDDDPLGAGGPPTTAEVNPGAQYDPEAGAQYVPKAPTGVEEDASCGTRYNPCSSDGLFDGAAPAAEDARSAVEALGEAHEAAAGGKEAQAVEPLTDAAPVPASPAGGGAPAEASSGSTAPAVEVPVGQPTAPAPSVGIGAEEYAPEEYAPAVGASEAELPDAATAPEEGPSGTLSGAAAGAADPQVAAPESAKPVSGEGDPEERTAKRPRPDVPTEARKSKEGAVPGNAPAIPLSATGGSLILALGVAALLFKRFGG